jgi:hypothetical protein
MKLLAAIVWVVVGAALTAGVYWGFLITPESTLGALMLSAVLAMAALAMAGLTMNGTVAIVNDGVSARAMRRAVLAVPAVVPAALIVLLVWWITGRIETWVAMRNGQISAWFIARFGWDDVSWLFTTIRYLAHWFRWVIAALLVLSLLAAVVTSGWRALPHFAWLRRALHPRAVIVATLLFVALIALPWIYLVPWRPKALPASSAELAFIVAKLSLSAILAAVAATLIAREVAAKKEVAAGKKEPATFLREP